MVLYFPQSNKMARAHITYFNVFDYLLILQTNILFKLTLLGQCIFYTCALFDQILKNYGIHSVLCVIHTHFVAMNAALFMGIIEYLKGKKMSGNQQNDINNPLTV